MATVLKAVALLAARTDKVCVLGGAIVHPASIGWRWLFGFCGEGG